MRKHLTMHLAAAAAIALLAAPALHARASSGDTPVVGQGARNMMGGGSGNSTGGMTDMMTMMQPMSQMTRNCGVMMTSMTTNRQWKQPTQPGAPERHD